MIVSTCVRVYACRCGFERFKGIGSLKRVSLLSSDAFDIWDARYGGG